MQGLAPYSRYPACQSLGQQAFDSTWSGIQNRNAHSSWWNQVDNDHAKAAALLAGDGTTRECENEIHDGVLDQDGVPTSPYNMGISGMDGAAWSKATGRPLPGQAATAPSPPPSGPSSTALSTDQLTQQAKAKAASDQLNALLGDTVQ
jgi:hypothetical protein